MRRFAIAFLTLVLLTAVAAPAHAAIKIRKISFDPAGADDGSNRHLNKEWIKIVNTGPNAVRLRGWKIVDKGRDHVYRFNSVYLEPGDTIRLRTGRGYDGVPACEEGQPCPDNANYELHWKLDNYVWNNDGDRARLIRPNGNVVDSCAYASSASSPKAC